jgi:hypothetical protein
MEVIKLALAAWFKEVSPNPQSFAFPVCSYSSIALAFPATINGTYPPLMDMRYGLAWHLHCNQVLTATTGPALQHFSKLSFNMEQRALHQLHTFRPLSLAHSAPILVITSSHTIKCGQLWLIPLSTSNHLL